MALTNMAPARPIFVDALERCLETGQGFGFNPQRGEMWVGDGPDDPDRYTYRMDEYEVQDVMNLVAGVAYIRSAL